MKYEVLKYFEDAHDKEHPYNAGDIYPRRGLKPTAERIKELMTSQNRRKEPFIKRIEEKSQTEAE